jgi:hypothetical protein
MLKKFYVATAFFLFFVALFLGIDRLAHHKSRHFSLDKITNTYPFCADWNVPPLSVEEQKKLDEILSQKFTYYSKGSQAYVLISEDKQYILKFLKQQKLHANSWLSRIPLSFNPYYQQRLFKESKARATFSACTTAFKELKEETGLIYVHINNAKDVNKKVVVFDKNGQKHIVDIDRTSFYVQKRAKLIYSRISELMHQGSVEEVKTIISSVFSLMDHLGKKGVVDNDPILRKNFGLINDTAVQIDVGKLRIDVERKYNGAHRKEVSSITHSFRVWLENNYPFLIEHFDQCLGAIIAGETLRSEPENSQEAAQTVSLSTQ